ncbi:MAG: STT3 domain-containing protein [Candidatus Thermoplasmatota archaeon]
MEEETKEKILTSLALILIFVLAFFIRSYFYYGPAVEPTEKYGKYNFVVSGNDPDYHKRAIDNVIRLNRHLMEDPLVNYPQGGINPNPPIFAWSTALFGIILSPLFGYDVELSTWYVFEFIPAFWAALTIIPVYFFTREMFGKKAGIWAALFIGIMAGNIERTPLGFSDHDSFYIFFVCCGFYFFMMGLKALENKRWIKSWRSASDITNGFEEFFKANKKSILYSVMAGLSIATVMLAWKGISYIFAILLMYYLFHLVINKIRKEDSLGIAFCTISMCLTALLVSFPYYYHPQLTNWYLTPFFMFFGIVVLTIFLVPTRDYPWLVVIPITFGLIGSAIVLLYYLLPTQAEAVLSFQGYFVRTKLYTTIAEAQPPDFSRLVFSYGIITFYLGLIGTGIMAIKLPKERWRNDYVFTLLWVGVSIYMSLSAVRFMYNATPVFAILGGWLTYELIVWLDFKTMLKTYRGMKTEKLRAIKSSVKVKHVVGALFIFGLIIFPNFWYGLDAGIPFETKKDYDKMIYRALPDFMRPKGYSEKDPNLWWFGAFGTSFPSDYWIDALWWLAEQDKELLPKDRPGFISWWDYGHWCTHMGEHPAAADNFQYGFEWAGNFITAQNEKQAIALIVTKIVEAKIYDREVEEILERYIGKDKVEEMKKAYTTPEKFIKEIKSNPDKYGEKDKDISPINAKYIITSHILMDSLETEKLVNLNSELEKKTGLSLRYFAVDSRLFPYNARNTGIYYAPVKLSDQDVNDFLQIKVIGNDGIEYDPDKIPEEKKRDPDFKITDYKLNYLDPFYNSMFYKAYIGYDGKDVGIGREKGGIPAMSGELRQSIPLQGWNMTHFRLAYRTVYWNPYKEDLVNHSEDWEVVPPSKAEEYGMKEKGTLDTMFRGLYQGVFFLKYYDGAFLNGTVKTEYGEPIKNVRITVFDDINLSIPGGSSFGPGIPHGYTFTDDEGRYSLIVPFGNLTLKATNGGLANPFMLTEKRELEEKKIFVSDAQAMRVDEDLDRDGIADYNLKMNFEVKISNVNGTVYIDMNDNNAFDNSTDKSLIGEINIKNDTLGKEYRTKTNEYGYYEVKKIIPADYNFEFEINGTNITKELSLNANESKIFDLSIKNGIINGSLYYKDKGIEGIKISAVEKNGYRVTNLSEKDGEINLTNLIPGKYRIEIEDDKYTIENLSGELEINETNATHQISINLIDAGIITGFTKPNTTVFFTDPIGNRYKTIANSSGSFKIKLSIGKYSIYTFAIENDSFYSHLSSIDVIGNTEYKINMEKAVKINGTTYLDKNNNNRYDAVLPTIPGPVTPGEGALPPLVLSEKENYVEIEFESIEGNITYYSNESGFYLAYLPIGNYTVRLSKVGENKSLSSLYNISLEENKTFDLKLMSGYELSGTLYYDINNDSLIDPDEVIKYGSIYISTNNKNITLITNSFGAYKTYLSEGNYELSAIAKGYEKWEGILEISNNTTKNIPITPKNVSLTGNISNISRIEVNFYARSIGARDLRIYAENGSYSCSLVPGNYLVEIDQKYNNEKLLYNASINISIGEELRKMDILLVRKVRLNGTIFVGNERTNNETTIKFISGEDMEEMKFNQSYEIYLVPGNHTIYAVDDKNAYLTELLLNTSLELNISLTEKIRIYGNVYFDENKNGINDGEGIAGIEINFSSKATLKTKSGDAGAYEVYLPKDAYNIKIDFITSIYSAVGERNITTWYLFNSTWTGKERNDINVSKLIKISGSVYYDNLEGINGKIKFTSKENVSEEAEIINGSYERFIEQGSYNVSVDVKGYESRNETWIANVSSDKAFFNFELEPKNVTLECEVLYYGEVNVRFIAMEIGGQNITIKAKQKFSISIKPSNYTVYIEKNEYINLSYLRILPSSEPIKLSFAMEKGSKLYGDVYYMDVDRITRNVEKMEIELINEKIKLTTESEKGTYKLYLPNGNYSLVGNYTTFLYGTEVKYFLNETIVLNGTTQRHIQLKKIDLYGANLSLEFKIIDYIKQGESINYTLSVRNTGNVHDSFKISAEPLPGWSVNISKKNIRLKIGESENISLEIKASNDAKADVNKIPIKALSLTSGEIVNSTNLEIKILQVYGVELNRTKEPPNALEDYTEYEIEVKNTGNGEDTINLTVVGVPYGWNVTLDDYNPLIQAGGSKEIKVKVVSPRGAAMEESVVIRGISMASGREAKSDEIYLKLTYPNLKAKEKDISAHGEHVEKIKKRFIPGFEIFCLIITLLIFIWRRKND